MHQSFLLYVFFREQATLFLGKALCFRTTRIKLHNEWLIIVARPLHDRSVWAVGTSRALSESCLF